MLLGHYLPELLFSFLLAELLLLLHVRKAESYAYKIFQEGEARAQYRFSIAASDYSVHDGVGEDKGHKIYKCAA